MLLKGLFFNIDVYETAFDTLFYFKYQVAKVEFWK